MIEIDRLDKRMDKFDDRLNETDQRLQETNLKLERNNILTEQNTTTMEKFSQTLEETSNTMREISYAIKQQSERQEIIEKSIDDTHRKIESVNTRIDCQEEKGKFDYILWIKNNFPVICLTIFYVLDKVGVL